jgi:type II secretory pathway predicted ATPase ExeA
MEDGMRCERAELRGLAGEVEAYLAWVLEQASGSVNLFTEDAVGG